MGYIVIDTCVWLELASKPNLRPLLDALREFVAPPPHQLVVPAPIMTEFHRNRDGCRDSWERGFRTHIQNFKFIYQAIPETRNDLVRVQGIAQEMVQKKRQVIEDNLVTVDTILAAAKSWHPGPDDYQDACTRCLEMRAPAVQKNRSSVGDCLIWRAVLDLLKQHCVWFCSANTSDFSNQKKKDELHPELATEASGGPHTLRYYSDPSNLVEDLRKLRNAPPPAVALPRYYDYAPSTPTRCPKCNADGSFTSGAYLRSQYGGLTWQYVCTSCSFHFDTGDFWD
ncbi:PIN domain-containing protein [Myxococcus sp. AB056]|uniref:PIN domain-containing protein n=1 Tax=Myxococcus sp. AB056 TaxID=2562792 RepID=UPI001146F006|nr:PIN domain-containing protein [Myxococcus sp. AB056]